jgi:type I restriction enzyme S subunit
VRNLKHKTLLYPDKLIRARLNEISMPEYIEIYFSSPKARRNIIECVKTTSGQKGISGKDIKAQMINVPDIEEQKQIVKRVESLSTLADKVEKQYQQAKQRTDKLTQSLLAKAFRGELVPQDPNDEPAEKLLARIQAERGKQKPVKKVRKNRLKKEA